MNLVREILKHDKIWETICISVPTPNSVRTPPPVSHFVIYAHAYCRMLNPSSTYKDSNPQNCENITNLSLCRRGWLFEIFSKVADIRHGDVESVVSVTY